MAVEDISELSEQHLRVKEKQKTVLRQFRKLAPLCDAVRENFHQQKAKRKNEDAAVQVGCLLSNSLLTPSPILDH